MSINMQHSHPHRPSKAEEEYFQKHNAQLLDKMRRDATLEQNHRQLAEATRVNSKAILDSLEELGFDCTTVRLLHLVPLVQVAWIDGTVSQAESDRISVIARLHGVQDDDTPAYQLLVKWLVHKPPEEFFARTRSALIAMLRALPPDQASKDGDALVGDCMEIASASGSFFGLNPSIICAEERELLEELAAQLNFDR